MERKESLLQKDVGEEIIQMLNELILRLDRILKKPNEKEYPIASSSRN